MQLRNIFEFPIDRPIEGVIKADDDASLKTEVEEYVLTNAGVNTSVTCVSSKTTQLAPKKREGITSGSCCVTSCANSLL